MKSWVKGMRDFFFESLLREAKKNRNIILITADTGAICHDEFKEKLSKQYINVGVAEQNMIGLAAGLAMAGKIVYVYGIIPFVTMRCYEQIRVDLSCTNLPVNIIGIGAGLDYSTLGATHHGTEDIALMCLLPGMKIYSPADGITAGTLVEESQRQTGPVYIRLDRIGLPFVYESEKDINFSKGFSSIKKGKDLYIIATGRMVYRALEVAKKLSAQSIDVGVIDLFKIKPLNGKKIWNVIKGVQYLVTLEEHFLKGGIGSAIQELIISKKNPPKFKSLGIPDKFCSIYGKREDLLNSYGLDIGSIVSKIKNWVEKENN
ncbi:MAG: 1-deoxy-D-xylulose-5-phosphate synthase [Candidatus Omnitrophica bacterium]|nr:1-deoxy-D-xylulose-5-phosphate synthase [Candidatus Omnitrophota bacterium]